MLSATNKSQIINVNYKTKFRSQTRPPYYQIVRGWWGEGGANIEGDSECGEASRTEKYILVM